jgi:hypothetical protein
MPINVNRNLSRYSARTQRGILRGFYTLIAIVLIAVVVIAVVSGVH